MIKYKRAGAHNYNDDTAWSTTSGGAADTVAPTSADDVVLDANSGDLTITVSDDCRSFDLTGQGVSPYTAQLTHNAGVTLSIGDATAGAGNIALAFPSSGWTYTLGHAESSKINFVSTSATVQTVNFGGKTTGSVTFDATSNGSWQYTGPHNTGVTGILGLNKGTLDINGQTCSWGLFSSSNSNTRTLLLGAANITLTGSGGSIIFQLSTTNGLTLDPGTSTITFTGTGIVTTNFGGKTLYNVVVNGPTSYSDAGFSAPTFTNFTFTGGARKTDVFSLGQGFGTFTVTGTITINSNSDSNRVLIQSSTVGSPRTITAGAVVITNTVDFKDIVGAGAATWTVAGTGATYLGDCGGNSGITFTTPTTQTVTMSTNKNMSDVTIYTSRIPLPQDDISMSGVTGGTLTADMPRIGKNIDWTGATGSPTWALSQSSQVFGNVTLISGMSCSGIFELQLCGRGNYTIQSNGASMPFTLRMLAPGGTYTQTDALVLTSTNGNLAISTSSGNLGTYSNGGFPLTLNNINISNNATKGCTLSGTINITNTTGQFITNTGANGTIDMSNADFVIINASSSTRTFAGNGYQYGSLTYTVAGSTGTLLITGNNTFNTLNFYDANNARTLHFAFGSTNIIQNWNVYGSPGKLITVQSNQNGTTFTLSKSSGIVSSNYLSLRDSIATGGATWYAGANSNNVSNNSGWLFNLYFTQVLTDSVSQSESLVKGTSKQELDSNTLNEMFSRLGTFFRLFVDLVTLNDTLTRQLPSATLLDSITPTSTIKRATTKVLEEDPPVEYLLGDDGDYLLNDEDGYFQLTGSGLNMYEAFTKHTTRSFTLEVISLIENFIKGIQKVATENLLAVYGGVFPETFKKAVAKNYIEVITLVETFINPYIKKFSRSKILLRIKRRVTMLK